MFVPVEYYFLRFLILMGIAVFLYNHNILYLIFYIGIMSSLMLTRITLESNYGYSNIFNLGLKLLLFILIIVVGIILYLSDTKIFGIYVGLIGIIIFFRMAKKIQKNSAKNSPGQSATDQEAQQRSVRGAEQRHRSEEQINREQKSLPFIHGWTAVQVQHLQQTTARTLQRDPVFHDRLSDGSPGPQMVIIPAGRFLMGSPEYEAKRNDRNDNERQHEVEITQSFALGQYPVTFEEYDRFCTATGRDNPSDLSWGRGQRPVIKVSWHDAMAYCAWLSQQTGQTYRLPTEAEWEYACRAGTTTPFYFGATISTDQANYDGNYTYEPGHKGQYREQTTPVGQFPANAWGLYDMHGNVWEWTGSVYNEDYRGAEQYRADAKESGKHVVRGGSWGYGPNRLRSAFRFWSAPALRLSGQGIRISRSL